MRLKACINKTREGERETMVARAESRVKSESYELPALEIDGVGLTDAELEKGK
jgi:hypothetical protein